MKTKQFIMAALSAAAVLLAGSCNKNAWTAEEREFGDGEAWLTVNLGNPATKVASQTEASEQTIRNMIARGNIREVRVGRRVLCDMTQLRKDVEAGKVGRGKHTKQRR